MAKIKTQYSCNDCGALAPKWSGQCLDCGAWNSFTEVVVASKKNTGTRLSGYAGVDTAEIIALKDVAVERIPRTSSGLSEFDRALGGGLVPGMVVLIGGDPGIGKSTILLQSVSSF